MNRPRLRVFVVGIMFVLMGYSFLLGGCSEGAQANTAAEGFNLHALIGVVRQSSSSY